MRADNASLAELAQRIAEELNIAVTVPDGSDVTVSADVAGTLEDVLVSLLPSQNYLIEYSAGVPVRLVVFDFEAADQSTITIAAPPVLLDTQNRRVVREIEGVTGPAVVPPAASRLRGGVSPARSAALPQNLSGSTAANPQSDRSNQPLPPPQPLTPAQEAAINAAAENLRRQSAGVAESLARDLKAICPPGHTC